MPEEFPTTAEIMRGAGRRTQPTEKKSIRFAEELAIFAAVFFVVAAAYIYFVLS